MYCQRPNEKFPYTPDRSKIRVLCRRRPEVTPIRSTPKHVIRWLFLEGLTFFRTFKVKKMFNYVTHYYNIKEVIYTEAELGFFTSWENIKIMPHYRPRVEYNFLQFHTIRLTKIVRLGINPYHSPCSISVYINILAYPVVFWEVIKHFCYII